MYLHTFNVNILLQFTMQTPYFLSHLLTAELSYRASGYVRIGGLGYSKPLRGKRVQ